MDECNINNGGCAQLCNNIFGSVFCSCYNGYNLVDNVLCQGMEQSFVTLIFCTIIDINECLNETTQNCEQICENTIGSYKCSCRLGYALTTNNISCERKFIIYNNYLIITESVQKCFETLSSPLNGTISCPNDQVTNSSCLTTCDPGFFLVGSAERLCLPNGTWSGLPSHCSPLPCPAPLAPDNGFIQLPCSPYYGSVCNVRCFERYTLIGSSEIQCNLEHGSNTSADWSSSGICKSM